MKILSSSQKKKIINNLNEQYGITFLPYLLIKFGKEKIRLYSGNLSKNELINLDRNLRIENIGIYFAKEQPDGIRLTIDSVNLININKNILEINNDESEKWLKGYDLAINTSKGFKILKNNDDFIGCGKSTGQKISNFVPKERRVKDII